MKRLRWINILVLIGLVLAACASQPVAPDTEQPVTESPAPQQTAQSETAEPESEEPAAVQAARQALAWQLGVPPDEIRIIDIEQTNWPDSCLGISLEGQACAAVVVPGYRVLLGAGEQQYEFRTDETGATVRLAVAPEPEIGAKILVWQNPQGICEAAQYGSQGAAFGVCDGPLMPGQLRSEELKEDLDYFAETYAPFEAQTPAGEVVFSGHGDQQASQAEQRMIAEWARLAFTEAVGGGSGASDGVALSWHREGGFAGFCDELTVYVTGEYEASSCRGEQPSDPERGRLDADQLEQLYTWIDELQPFEINQTDPATADAMTTRLIFFGAGDAQPSQADQQAVLDFATQVYAEAAQESGITPSTDLEAARQVLLDYFAALEAGRFAEAADYYGGSYEILTGYNPNIPPDDRAALWEAACQFNGFQCLAIREIVEAEQVSSDAFVFTVEFSTPDGDVFVRGPCCGATETEMPPESRFQFTVLKQGDQFLVQELPVYVP